MSVRTISPTQLKELRGSGRPIDLIDVRTPVEYREIHVEFARNVPLERFNVEEVLRHRNGSADEPLYVICRSGARGRQACEKLIAAGCAHVINVEGGTLACADADLPVVRGKKAVSVERQVRIVAGLMVVAGVLLGWLVHPGWLGVSAFVGLGLAYAGVTDTCGMGMILARMPWNQVRGTGAKCGTA